MTSPLRTALLIAALLVSAPGKAAAELYKWVDRDGGVHFSDSPPRGQDAVNLRPDDDADRAASGSLRTEVAGIPYEGNEPSRLAYLQQVMVQFPDVPPGRSKVVGELQRGAHCSHERDVKLKSGYEFKRQDSLRWHFHERLQELGYRSPQQIKTRFDLEGESAPELGIIAIVTELEVSECHLAGSRRGSDGRVKNASNMTVEWQVRDNLRRRVVYETTTHGSFRDGHFQEKQDDTPGSLERAFLEAGAKLLADPSFVALLAPTSGRATASATNEAAERLSLAVVDGACAGGGNRFQARYERLTHATATIRTPGGHGSGFLVSDDGFVLTNEHVVAGARRVIVVLDDEEYDGTVVSSDPLRDVALVELEELPPADALPVCRERAAVGQSIYVIGTPLDEKLSLSVTKGIISQHRTIEDQPYYQTDAVINKGNSGGPAFNEQGEVIGIAVAGTFAKDGAGMGINYLIPIDEALRALVAPPAARRR